MSLDKLNAALAAIQAVHDRYHDHVDPVGALQKATSEAAVAAAEVATELHGRVSAAESRVATLESKLHAITENLAAQANSLHSTVAQLADTAGLVHEQVPVIEPDRAPAAVTENPEEQERVPATQAVAPG